MWKCTPPPVRARVNFRTVFAWWLRFGDIFRRSLRSLRGRRLKKVVNFWGKKVHPQTKSWLRLCFWIVSCSIAFCRLVRINRLLLVCQTITFKSLHVGLESLYCTSGVSLGSSSSDMKVVGSRSRSQGQKGRKCRLCVDQFPSAILVGTRQMAQQTTPGWWSRLRLEDNLV